MRGIRNRQKGRPSPKKAPLIDTDLTLLVDTLDTTTLAGARDRALLLIGFTAAQRRSELVVIDVKHLVFRPEGLTLTIPFSITDQAGDGSRDCSAGRYAVTLLSSGSHESLARRNRTHQRGRVSADATRPALWPGSIVRQHGSQAHQSMREGRRARKRVDVRRTQSTIAALSPQPRGIVQMSCNRCSVAAPVIRHRTRIRGRRIAF